MELAGSTFGEDDLATQKRLYLHNALNGFLPLIYEIDSEGVDYDRFLEACGKVWKSLETNSELPDNLVRFFTWIEGDIECVLKDPGGADFSTGSVCNPIAAHQ